MIGLLLELDTLGTEMLVLLFYTYEVIFCCSILFAEGLPNIRHK